MAVSHLGQSFVLALIQLDVSESSIHFWSHFFKYGQQIWNKGKRLQKTAQKSQMKLGFLTGSCWSFMQTKQNECPHEHVTVLASTCGTLITFSQFGEGHHFNKLLHSTKELINTCWYLTFNLEFLSTFRIALSSMTISQPGHWIIWRLAWSVSFADKYSSQHEPQNASPHSELICKLDWKREKLDGLKIFHSTGKI